MLEVSKGRFGGDGTWDFEAKAVFKARFGGDQRLGVSETIAKLKHWAYWVFGSPGKGQYEARHGMAWHGMSCHGMAWYGSVWQGEAKHGKAWQCKARQGSASQGKAIQSIWSL